MQSHYFMFYRDDDIGINEKWRSTMIPQVIDNDQDTDNETLKTATEEGFITLREGIIQFTEDKSSLRNKPNAQ
jgi:hypothetical protein